MKYKVLKSSLDGISGGGSSYDDIAEVLREISYHKGWDSLKQLHDSIRKWSQSAIPGSVYMTQVTAIVAVAVSSSEREDDVCHHCGVESETGLDYGELEPVEGGEIEQEVTCPECGRRWRDVFVLAEQRELVSEEGGAA